MNLSLLFIILAYACGLVVIHIGEDAGRLDGLESIDRKNRLGYLAHVWLGLALGLAFVSGAWMGS